MRKILWLTLLATMAVNSFAVTSSESAPQTRVNKYQSFQQFDRQYNLGYAVISVNTTNGSANGVYNSQAMSLEVERLFDIGVWMDVTASLLTYYSQAADPAVPTLGNTTGSQPMFGGVNAKVGYAFPVLANHLMLTPYALIGRNTNLSSYTLANAGTTTNLTQNYFWSVGGGGRIEYRLNQYMDFYFDQNAVYNASQAPVVGGLAANDNYSYTSTLGAKFNLYRNFQLGAQAFYTNYYFTQSLQQQSPAATAAVPVNQVGAMLTAGLTY